MTEPRTDDEWTEDEWGEEEEASPAAPRRKGRWRAFAAGAAVGALLLAGLALLGGGGGESRDRALSPEVAAVFHAPEPFSMDRGPGTPGRLGAASPGFAPGLAPGLDRADPLATGDIPARVLAPGLPPPPAFVPPGDWEQGWAPMELDGDPAPPHLSAFPSASGLAREAGVSTDLEPAPAPSPEAMRLESALLAPPGADAAPVADLAGFAEEAAAAVGVEAPAAAPAPRRRPEPQAETPAPPEEAPAPAPAPVGESAPADSPAPRPRPPAPEHALRDGGPSDPDVYSPPRTPPQALQAATASPAPLAGGPRGGWSARLKLEGAAEIALAAAAPPPVHDPEPPKASAAAPIHDPAPTVAASAPAAEAPAAPQGPPMISAAVKFGAEFGPEITPEAFAAMDLAPEPLETGDLPRVRTAPIDSPEDGPFSARSEEPFSAPAPRRRAAEPVLPPDAPRATVVLTALGLHEATTNRAIRDTPDAVALAFAPIGRRVEERVASLGAAGRVALVEAPMEAMSRSATPDEITLATGLAAEENQARLARVLALAPRAAGISTYMGARFTADAEALAGVLPILAQRGLMLLENQPTNRSLLRDSARSAGVRYAAAPIALDRERSATAIRAALAQLERRALADGEAVGVMAVSGEALDALALWTEGLASRGVRLAPLGEALE
ncbi:divergent polysaccharide deacetylase family protein [Neomegalonema sp.]|uniref:divergent polysaccharide deacetylase family protein n=1 Tax=Neomegalonema sp. TaxID=2039713 RepID=UPI0026222147|nr:divergent polysaccharide deacetylase family protein [Neomegalonema sp.]MDD2869552.1 divergent polysaccharide deacetylase family protein [Neomegalonema sp.]